MKKPNQMIERLNKLLSEGKDIILMEFNQREKTKVLNYKKSKIWNVVTCSESHKGEYETGLEDAIKVLNEDKIIAAYCWMDPIIPNLRVYYIIKIKDLVNDFSFYKEYGLTEQIILDTLDWTYNTEYRLVDYEDFIMYNFILNMKKGCVDTSMSHQENGIHIPHSTCQCEYCQMDED